ncbi:MAG TPA: hypothetical protein VFB21_21600 [Chthonomonadaceae bacterium]|nr:hypothetical protein [Chthonomonadaceae bacterium]
MPASSTPTPADKPSVGKPVIFAAIVALLLFCVWLYRINFKTVPGPQIPEVDHDLIRSLAIKCKGDFYKLSPEEQAKVNSMENGYGVVAISRSYQRTLKSASK